MKNYAGSFLCLVMLFLIGCSRGGDWVQFRGVDGTGLSRSRITPPLGIRWKIRLQEEGAGIIRSLNPPVVIGNTVYFGSDDGNFYALDLESGFMRWVFKSGAEINSIPFANEDNVFFGSQDGRLYALCRRTGNKVWYFQTQSQINSLVQGYGDHIIFVGDADAIYFLYKDGTESFRINNPGWFKYTFAVRDNIMYFGTGPIVELVGPFDIANREFLWFLNFNDFNAQWYSFSAIKNDLVFFGTTGMFWSGLYLGFYAYNRHTGERIWEYETEAVLDNFTFEDTWRYFLRNIDLLDYMAPAIWRNSVIFAGGDKVARSFDTRTGRLRWERKFDRPISSAPTIAAGRVYFGLLGDDYNPPQLICISARDGRVLWQMDLEGSILSAPVIAGRRIIFGTDESIFYVLEQVF